MAALDGFEKARSNSSDITMNDEPASPILNAVVSEFDNTTPIPHDTVKGWMESQDIETMGALINLLADPKHFSSDCRLQHLSTVGRLKLF